MTPVGGVSALFAGRKAKWLPLYRRLIARLSQIPGIEVRPRRAAIAVVRGSDPRATVGSIRVSLKGIDLRVSGGTRRKITHRVLIAEPTQIDDELLSWVRAANQRARSARRRSA